jgi:hypothetical protein
MQLALNTLGSAYAGRGVSAAILAPLALLATLP